MAVYAEILPELSCLTNPEFKKKKKERKKSFTFASPKIQKENLGVSSLCWTRLSWPLNIVLVDLCFNEL